MEALAGVPDSRRWGGNGVLGRDHAGKEDRTSLLRSAGTSSVRHRGSSKAGIGRDSAQKLSINDFVNKRLLDELSKLRLGGHRSTQVPGSLKTYSGLFVCLFVLQSHDDCLFFLHE